jgi:hypothetical protein
MQLILKIKEKGGKVKTELIVKDQDNATKYEKFIGNFYYDLIKNELQGKNDPKEETVNEET